MPKSVKTLLVVAIIVLLWAVASGVYGWLLRWVQPCMSLGVSLCAGMLLILSHDENGWRRATFQSYIDDPNEPPNFLPFFVWGTPLLILFMALVEVLRRWLLPLR